MPKITVHGGQSFEVDADKRLILALRDQDVDILHRCGGYAGCTTCRVKFYEGEPDKMTVAEYKKISGNEELSGKARLSCQILCDHDMEVEPLFTLEETGLDGRGNRPQDHLTPEPEWMDLPDELKS